jgi:hypothetical protein
MARSIVGTGLVGVFVFFLAVLVLAPMIKNFFPQVSGFENMMGMSCQQGLKPCPEGYFCEQSACVPILPRYNVNEVKPGGY